MTSPGLEPGTACVLDRSDNQLHHEASCSSASSLFILEVLSGSSQLLLN